MPLTNLLRFFIAYNNRTIDKIICKNIFAHYLEKVHYRK